MVRPAIPEQKQAVYGVLRDEIGQVSRPSGQIAPVTEGFFVVIKRFVTTIEVDLEYLMAFVLQFLSEATEERPDRPLQ